MSDKNTEAEMKTTFPPSLVDSDEQEIEIDLLELGYVLLSKVRYIIICLLAGALLFGAFAYFMIEPTYKSTSKLYVVSSSEDSVVNLSDLNLGTSLASDYEELILSYPVLDIVIDKMDLDMTSDELAQMITLNNPSNTRLLEITVTSTDPMEAMELANEIAEVAIEYLPDTMSTPSPNLAQTAKVATKKSAPSYTRYTLIGAILGLLLSCGVIIVIYLLNDTISSGQELEKYFGMVPLTEIPDNEVLAEYSAPSENKKGWRNLKRGGKRK